ncbi:HARB1-like protein, partial [Mya arenaria]
LLLTLRYLGKGDFYSEVSDLHGVSRSSMILGAVDGTLMPIITPHDNEEVYVCRRGFHALNIQAVVNSNMRFVFRHLELNNVGMLLGDSGYPLRHYLMTPVLQLQGRQQTAYNVAHARGRVVVEQAFGLLKSRF